MAPADPSQATLKEEVTRLRREIADLKRRERDLMASDERLKNSARKYRLMAEKAAEGFMAVEDDRIRFYNHRVLELTGLGKEQLLQRTFPQLFHPADRHRLAQHCRQGKYSANGSGAPMFRMLCRNAELRWVEINCTPIVWEARPALLVAAMDRTDRVQASDSLRESEARYRTLFEHAEDAIFFETENREIVDVNRRACEMFGYSRGELLAMKTSDLFPQADAWHSIYLNPALALETATESEAQHRAGHRLPVETTISPLVSGRKTIFMSIVRDCTERKKSEEDRVRQEKLEAVLELTGAVCHELSQPMMAIFGYTELVTMRMSKQDPIYDEILKIGQQVDRMGKITAKLMSITRYKTRDYLEGKIIDLDGASDEALTRD
jgi:PAS domain S-box-containing protein